MDEQINRLVAKTYHTYQRLPATQRLLIAISGVPGCGKSTIATHVVAHLNTLHQSLPIPQLPVPIAACIPLDGFHLPRHTLSQLPHASEAHARRGAPFTFSPSLFLRLVHSLSLPISATTPTIYAPSFSHALKDPVENDIPIPTSIRICVFEGNYLSLNWGEWKQTGDLMHEHWFVNVADEVAEKRLVRRHVESGICRGVEEARERVRGSDARNAREILGAMRPDVSEFVQSVDEVGLREEVLDLEGPGEVVEGLGQGICVVVGGSSF